MYQAGIDIGGTKVIIGFVDRKEALLFQKKYLIPESAKQGDFSDWLLSTLEKAARSAGISLSELEHCGIGVPGTVSTDGQTVLKAPNLHWENRPLAAEFTRISGLPAVLIQDSRAAAWGEYKAGGGRGARSLICVTLGTGIGTGIVLDGKIFHGSLSWAGELGHVPVNGSGRMCGCGKTDCLEKYAAGIGLGLTARELFDEQADAEFLFEKARAGSSRARRAIDQAVEMLGKVLVSAVNLLSPDCLLFSGGLSRERELYVDPLIGYIESHCYSLEKHRPRIGLAELGEAAPMMGCALLPHRQEKRRAQISASIMCADFMNLGNALAQLEESGVDYIHYDIMDNHFVPNMMLPPELIGKLRRNTSIPFDVHIMAEEPERLIPALGLRPGDICSIHWESTRQFQRALALVRETGAKVSAALNPGTPVEMLREVAPMLDAVLIMTVEPGFAGQKMTPQALEKIRRARKLLDSWGCSRIPIQVDGNCSFENIPKMRESGADIFVVGSSSVFHPDTTIKKAMDKIRSEL